MTGRPSKYNPDYHPEQAYKYCLLGATDKELAAFFEVEEKTINNWKEAYPEFMQSLRAGKEEADAVIASKLFHRAKGYEHKDTKFATFEGQITDSKEYIRHYPPDTVAAIFWLKNRQRGRWRDKVDHELAGPDGAPLQVVFNIPRPGGTPDGGTSEAD